MQSAGRTRRVLAFAAFAAVILAVMAAGHLYIARRLILDPGLPEPWRGAALVAVALLGGLLVLQPAAERLLRTEAHRALGRVLRPALAWPAALWMGLAFLLLVGLAATDLLLALGGAASDPGGVARVRAAAVVGLAGAAAAAGLRSALRPPALRRLELRLPRWPRCRDGYRIVQISDIHIGPLLDRRFARTVVERVNALDADLVAVTGDLVDGREELLADEVAPFAALRARDGVYFVPGNHDHYSGVRAWLGRVRALGMRPLVNQRTTLGEGEAAFDLAGVDDAHAHLVGSGSGEDLDAALAGRDPERPLVLLAHDPGTFRRAAGRGVDLQLSGHTHGGQIWPFSLVVRAVVPFVAGHYRRGASQLYVSRGTGFWGPPMRLLAPAEITEIVLRRGAEA